MTIHIATPKLVVLEADNGALAAGMSAQGSVRTALEYEGIEQWSSIEIEDYTYCDRRLIFATPIKVYIPNFLARLLD